MYFPYTIGFASICFHFHIYWDNQIFIIFFSFCFYQCILVTRKLELIFTYSNTYGVQFVPIQSPVFALLFPSSLALLPFLYNTGLTSIYLSFIFNLVHYGYTEKRNSLLDLSTSTSHDLVKFIAEFLHYPIPPPFWMIAFVSVLPSVFLRSPFYISLFCSSVHMWKKTFDLRILSQSYMTQHDVLQFHSLTIKWKICSSTWRTKTALCMYTAFSWSVRWLMKCGLVP